MFFLKNFIIRLDALICAAYIKNYLKISLKNKAFRITVLSYRVYSEYQITIVRT